MHAETSAMASHMRHLSRSLLQIGRRIPAKRKCIQQWHCPQPQCRAFSRTTLQFADEDENLKPAVPPSTPAQLDNEVFTVEDMNPEMRADYEQLSKEEQAQALQDINRTINTMPSPEEEAELERQMKAAIREINQQIPEEYDNTPLSPREIGFWADDEDDEFAQVPDDDDEFDEADISTIAHSDLELHREMREYQRIVAWEMPLLNSKPPPIHIAFLTII
jgi:small subunit ribosomal protein S35